MHAIWWCTANILTKISDLKRPSFAYTKLYVLHNNNAVGTLAFNNNKKIVFAERMESQKKK